MKIISYPTAALTDIAWEDVPHDRIIDGAPQCRSQLLYTDKTSSFFSGIYECTRGKWRISYTEDEFCTLIEGTLRLRGDDGEEQEYHAPNSFLIPAGFSGIWEAITPIRKLFVIYENNQETKV